VSIAVGCGTAAWHWHYSSRFINKSTFCSNTLISAGYRTLGDHRVTGQQTLK